MSTKNEKPDPKVTELSDDELAKTDGGFAIANGGGDTVANVKKPRTLQARGNNVFGFEDLPNN